jgi:hypothetical protein
MLESKIIHPPTAIDNSAPATTANINPSFSSISNRGLRRMLCCSTFIRVISVGKAEHDGSAGAVLGDSEAERNCGSSTLTSLAPSVQAELEVVHIAWPNTRVAASRASGRLSSPAGNIPALSIVEVAHEAGRPPESDLGPLLRTILISETRACRVWMARVCSSGLIGYGFLSSTVMAVRERCLFCDDNLYIPVFIPIVKLLTSPAATSEAAPPKIAVGSFRLAFWPRAGASEQPRPRRRPALRR